MAVRIITTDVGVGPGEHHFEFDGEVRQFVIGISRWHLRFHDQPSDDPNYERLELYVVHRQQDGQRERIYFSVEASVAGVWPAMRTEDSRVWVSCIADVGRHERDQGADPCVAFQSYHSPKYSQPVAGVALPAERKIEEAFCCGVSYYYRDKAPTEGKRSIDAKFRLSDDLLIYSAGVIIGTGSTGNAAEAGLVVVAKSEGRVFCKTVKVQHAALETGCSVDFTRTIGGGVPLDRNAVAFLKGFNFEPARHAGSVAEIAVGAVCSVDGQKVRLDGPMLRMLSAGESGSGMGPEAYVELAVFVRTEPVVITDHRGDVEIRLSGDRNKEYWEYEVAGHWHEISRSSDVLEWQARAEGEHVRVTIGNNCQRDIQLTVNDTPIAGILPLGQTHTEEVSAAVKKVISGWFVDTSDKLPDPTFDILKQGGGGGG